MTNTNALSNPDDENVVKDYRIFDNPEFGSIHTVVVDGKPYFVGKDVAKILGYANFSDAIKKHIDEEDKGVAICDTLGGKQKFTIINESGLYSLILASKLPTAKKFKKWVTSEVLPSINHNGAYMTPETLQTVLLNPDYIITLATQLKEYQNKNRELNNKNIQLNTVNKALTAETLYWKDKDTVNRAVRIIAGKLNRPIYKIYNALYAELRYKHHIGLSNRGSKPFIRHVRDNEWQYIQKSLTAICEANNLDTEYVIRCSQAAD